MEQNKAQFLYKTVCPSGEHGHNTPSCGVYSDGSGYCFSCNQYFSGVGEPVKVVEKPKENLEEKLVYIDSLKKIQHRGLQFPSDDRGYYVVWPDRKYYKLRAWAAEDLGGKYLGPSGHQKPIFSCTSSKKSKIAIIVEGEINALSIITVIPGINVYSPGGVTSFYDRTMTNNLSVFSGYASIYLIADRDVVGLVAVLKLKELLKPYCSDIVTKLMDEDANHVLCEYGQEALKEKLNKMGVQTRM